MLFIEYFTFITQIFMYVLRLLVRYLFFTFEHCSHTPVRLVIPKLLNPMLASVQKETSLEVLHPAIESITKVWGGGGNCASKAQVHFDYSSFLHSFDYSSFLHSNIPLQLVKSLPENVITPEDIKVCRA